MRSTMLECNLASLCVEINTYFTQKQQDTAHPSSIPAPSNPTKSDRINTLRERLLDPSMPEGLKRHVQAAIDKITYGRVAR
jgi:hypothetical protein